MGRGAPNGGRRWALPAVAACTLGLTPAACGSGGEEPAGGTPPGEPSRAETPGRTGAASAGAAGGGAEGGSRLEPPPCPPEASNCARAAGTILYVERVDPDGDGDAHFVLLSSESITGPGISVIDVARELRPAPLPEPGDTIAAAGPVFRGSYGQRQIQATALRVAR